jgi:hypothetical protein
MTLLPITPTIVLNADAVESIERAPLSVVLRLSSGRTIRLDTPAAIAALDASLADLSGPLALLEEAALTNKPPTSSVWARLKTLFG